MVVKPSRSMALMVSPVIFRLRPQRSTVRFWSRSRMTTSSPLWPSRPPMPPQAGDLPTPPFEDAKDTIMKHQGSENEGANGQIHTCPSAQRGKLPNESSGSEQTESTKLFHAHLGICPNAL